MTSRKIRVIAGAQLVSLALVVLIGFADMVPKYGWWGVAFTGIAVSQAVFWIGLLVPSRPTTKPSG